ncbi:MAG TPA: hypothetical protein VIY69_04765 [Candidatus Acidoferrales bacterium]
MSHELETAIAGGLVGGVVGVLGTLLASYWCPRKLDEWREKRLEDRNYGPRKRLLKKLLEHPDYPEGRSIERLARVSGTTEDECRRLLIEIDARGVTLKDDKEGWALISRNPLD